MREWGQEWNHVWLPGVLQKSLREWWYHSPREYESMKTLVQVERKWRGKYPEFYFKSCIQSISYSKFLPIFPSFCHLQIWFTSTWCFLKMDKNVVEKSIIKNVVEKSTTGESQFNSHCYINLNNMQSDLTVLLAKSHFSIYFKIWV